MMRELMKVLCVVLLMALLSFGVQMLASYGQSDQDSQEPSEKLEVVVSMWAGENGARFVTNNLYLTLVNHAPLPLNTSLPAFGELFRSARFSVVSGQGLPNFWVFLRTSYNATASANEVEAYSDDILSEFRKIFNLQLDVMNETYATDNETTSIDVYYRLSDLPRDIMPFEELAKYCPAEGYGQLVSPDLLNLYLQYDYIPGTAVHQHGIFNLEYTLNRVDQTFVWQFDLELLLQAQYQNESNLSVNFRELLGNSEPIAPSLQGFSQIRLDIWKKEETHGTPLFMSFANSSPSCTSLKDEGDTIVVIWNVTAPVENIVVTLDVASETTGGDPTLIYAIITVSAFCMASVVVFTFAKVRKRKQETGHRKP